MAARAASRINPLTLVVGALALAGAVGVLRHRPPPVDGSPPCEDGPDALCTAAAGLADVGETEEAASVASAVTLTSSEACRNVGYLCAELERSPSIRVQRWKDFQGTIVVRIPRPEFETASDGIALQQAAAIGLRAWNGQPFEILTDTRGDREAHFAVEWTRSLGGSQIGLTRTRWSPAGGLSVVSISLSTRSPFNPDEVIDAPQVRLTAAHEMGHALGLPHSNAPRDVMYPTNSATSLSAQDYRTMESLYRLPDGAQIVR